MCVDIYIPCSTRKGAEKIFEDHRGTWESLACYCWTCYEAWLQVCSRSISGLAKSCFERWSHRASNKQKTTLNVP